MAVVEMKISERLGLPGDAPRPSFFSSSRARLAGPITVMTKGLSSFRGRQNKITTKLVVEKLPTTCFRNTELPKPHKIRRLVERIIEAANKQEEQHSNDLLVVKPEENVEDESSEAAPQKKGWNTVKNKLLDRTRAKLSKDATLDDILIYLKRKNKSDNLLGQTPGLKAAYSEMDLG
jgi:hypothetical protein